MTYVLGQTAVIVPVPAAESAVSSWRSHFDSSAPFGVPAHITVVFPFVPQDRLTAGDLTDLAAIFVAEPAFIMTLSGFGRFPSVAGAPEVLYLEPKPPAPFRRLTAALTARWPAAPPYGGMYDEPIPHLTLTDVAPPEAVVRARTAVARYLPIDALIDRGSLIRFDGTRWCVEAMLPLGAAR